MQFGCSVILLYFGFSTVDDQDILTFGDMRFTVHFTPGHTEGHVVYMLDGAPYGMSDSLFSGDHLFLGGCGKIHHRVKVISPGNAPVRLW